jgi:predicted neuraminidase
MKKMVAISEDGINWKPLLILENEPKGEFSYPTVMQTADGNIHVTYTWKRKKVKHVVIKLT